MFLHLLLIFFILSFILDKLDHVVNSKDCDGCFCCKLCTKQILRWGSLETKVFIINVKCAALCVCVWFLPVGSSLCSLQVQ